MLWEIRVEKCLSDPVTADDIKHMEYMGGALQFLMTLESLFDCRH